MIFTKPAHRRIATTGGYPGGWLGIKPYRPTINWSNKFMARCVGLEGKTAIVWCDSDRQPHELVRDEANQSSTNLAVPMVFDSEPCARHLNGKESVDEVSTFSPLVPADANDQMAIIEMIAPIDWYAGDLAAYCHAWTDNNLFDDGTNYALSFRNRRAVDAGKGLALAVSLYTNKGGVKNMVAIDVGPDGADWPAGTWAILGAHANGQTDENSMVARRPAAPVVDLSAALTAAGGFDGTGTGTHTRIGTQQFTSSSRNARAYVGFVYHLPIAMSPLELQDMVDNPYQIFNWP